MQARLKTDFCKNLYDFWGADIYSEVKDELILNLASEEYAKTVRYESYHHNPMNLI